MGHILKNKKNKCLFSWDYAINSNESGDKNEKQITSILKSVFYSFRLFPLIEYLSSKQLSLKIWSNVKENICLVQKLITRVAV